MNSSPLLRPSFSILRLASRRTAAAPSLTRRYTAFPVAASLPSRSSVSTTQFPVPSDGLPMHTPISPALSTATLPERSSPLPRPTPDLGFLSLTFAFSMVVSSFFSLVIVSLPVLSSFKRLEASMDKLSKVVSEEVPGTLISMKLSGLEINELTEQLDYLRQIISGTQGKKRERNEC